MRWLSSLREDRKGLSLIAVALAFARVARWVGVAIFVSFRIDHGALDAPRPLKKPDCIMVIIATITPTHTATSPAIDPSVLRNGTWKLS